MKYAVLALLLSVINCFASASNQESPRQIQDLIHSLPAFEQIKEDFALTEDVIPANEKQREAKARLQQATERFKRLRSLIRIGTSIFAYPGLLALSPSRYLEFDNKYGLVLGIPCDAVRANGEGTEIDMFEVIFDGRGIITEIRPVIAAE